MCFPDANIVLATAAVWERRGLLQNSTISFNKSILHFSLYLILCIAPRDFQAKLLEICYFRDVHHTENERVCRWADTENAQADTEGWGQTEMWRDMLRPLNTSSVHCQRKRNKQTSAWLVFPVLVATLPLLALAQICQSFFISMADNVGGKFMFKIRWLTDTFNYPCLHKLTQLDSHKILKASLWARGLLSLPLLAVLKSLFPCGEQRFQSPAAKCQCCTHHTSTKQFPFSWLSFKVHYWPLETTVVVMSPQDPLVIVLELSIISHDHYQ